jgi:hypothetical protein
MPKRQAGERCSERTGGRPASDSAKTNNGAPFPAHKMMYENAEMKTREANREINRKSINIIVGFLYKL